MKRELYDLTDDPFAMFVNRVGEVLREEGIPHNIVGGAAVQGQVLSMLVEKYGIDVYGLIADPDIRVQDYLRSTDDVDVALKLEGDDRERIRRINGILPRFAFEDITPNGESIVEVRHGRVGASRPTYRIYIDGKGSDEKVIVMNIGRGNKNGKVRGLDTKWYDEFIDQSQRITVPYAEGFEIVMNIPRLEHLLASKIAGSRAKDLMDIKNLVDLTKSIGRGLDVDEIGKILLPVNERNYGRFIASYYNGNSH